MKSPRPLNQAARPLSQRNWLLGCIVILLAYYVTRLPHLLTLPLFIDEATHLTRAQTFWQGQPLNLFLNGKAGPLYLVALFDPFHAPIWLGRFIIALFGGLGVAASIGVGRLLGGRTAGLLAGILWVGCPYLFFYERMVLVDAPLAAFATFAAWTALRMMSTGRARDALLCGIALVLCAFDKVTGLVFFALPIAAIVLPGLSSWRVVRLRIRQLVLAYGLAAVIMIGPVLIIIAQQDNILGIGALTTTSTTGLSDRLSTNTQLALSAFQTYFGGALFAILVGGAIFALIDRPRRALIGLALIVVPLLSLIVVGQILYLRYVVIAVPGLLILAAIGWASFATQAARWIATLRAIRLPLILSSAITLLAIAVLLPFINTAYSDPSALPLPRADQREYVRDWSSGYGLREAAFDLLARAKASSQPLTAIGMVGSCDTLRLYVPLDSLLTIQCPDVWDATGAGMALGEREIDAQRTTSGTALVLAEEAGPVAIEAVPQPRALLQSYPRPAGVFTVQLYAVTSMP